MDADTALAADLARDLDAAFPILVAGHADRLFTIAFRLIGDPSDAEEVAQDALVRAYRALASYEASRIMELRLRPWLASITVNLARNKRRRVADRHPAQPLEALTETGFDPRDDGSADPPAVAVGRESAEELGRLLLELPASLRAAVVLRHVDGLSIADIAMVLGRPEGTIKAHVSRGLDRLRTRLSTQADGSRGAAEPPRRHRSSNPRSTSRVLTEVLR